MGSNSSTPNEKEGAGLNLTKKEIVKKLKSITKEDAINDFEKLKKIDCNNINDISQGSRVGANFVDYFTMLEKLETKGRANISFF